MRTVSTCAVSAVLLFSATTVAVAQPAADSAADTAAARSLFQEGLQLSDREQWVEAADRFRRSLSLRPSPVVSYNLASALARTGDVVEASELLRSVARDEQADPGAREAAQALLATITPRIAQLTLQVEGDADTVELTLDGEPFRVEAVGVGVPVDPGSHTIMALRGGESVAETTFEVAEGGSVSASLTLPPPPPDAIDPEDAEWEPSWGPLPDPVLPDRDPEPRAEPRPVAPPSAPPPVEETSWWESPLFWTGVGVGAAALAAAVVVIVVVAGGGEPAPIQGNLDPNVIELGR